MCRTAPPQAGSGIRLDCLTAQHTTGMCSTQQYTVRHNISAMLCMLCLMCVLCRGLEDAAHAPAEEGAEVEVLSAAGTAAAAAGGSSGGGGSAVNSSSRGGGRFDARVSDQDVFTGDYEVAAAGGQPLMW